MARSSVRRMSWRDPAGELFAADDRLLRAIAPHAVGETETALRSPVVRRLQESGKLIAATPVAIGALPKSSQRTPPGLVLEHPRVPFPSFPGEWPAVMLHEAATLTLDIAEALLEKQLGLKDASPFNVLFQATRAIHVDFLSVEERRAEDPLWLPFAQFHRGFLNPLLAHRHLALPIAAAFAGGRDGLGAEELYAMSSWYRRLLPPMLTAASLPVWMGRFVKHGEEKTYRPRKAAPETAAFVLRHLFRGLRRKLRALTPREPRSLWTSYPESGPYGATQRASKRAFVELALREHGAKRVLDLGANTGEYSEVAAGTGASVVAVDSDPAAVTACWLRAKRGGHAILPLTVDISRPTPSFGWRSAEFPSFLERATGHFDTVLALGLLHHLTIVERAAPVDVAALLADLTTSTAIVEVIGPADGNFRHLCRGRDYSHLTVARVEADLATFFRVEKKEAVPGMDRALYVLRKKQT